MCVKTMSWRGDVALLLTLEEMVFRGGMGLDYDGAEKQKILTLLC